MENGKRMTLVEAMALPPDEYQRFRQTQEGRALLGELGSIEWLDEEGEGVGPEVPEKPKPGGTDAPVEEGPGAWGEPDEGVDAALVSNAEGHAEAGGPADDGAGRTRARGRRSCRLALRGLRVHVSLVAVAGLAMAGRLAVASLPYLDAGFASPLSTASTLLASMTWALPLLSLVAAPTALLAVAAAGVPAPVTRACALMAWAIDAVTVAALLALTALSAMASGLTVTCALGAALVGWAYLAVNDSLCARAARDES